MTHPVFLLLAGSAENDSLATDVAVSCLNIAISCSHGHTYYLDRTAAMIFPLLFALPQVLSDFHLTSDLIAFC